MEGERGETVLKRGWMTATNVARASCHNLVDLSCRGFRAALTIVEKVRIACIRRPMSVGGVWYFARTHQTLGRRCE
ncbi:hypothetical protein LZ30DRAFT_742989 [Colletotrichum cereale]|nr:hypothetical protein LZ30DRAFT_742989 [Colletotrichum cereale]